MLTVVIPSFNRKSNLKHILHELNMIKENFDIIVFNNDPNEKFDRLNLLPKNFIKNIEIHNTDIHYGPDASLLFAMSLVKSEYIYLLGDSKVPDPAVFKDFEIISRKHNFNTLVYSYKSEIDNFRQLSIAGLANSSIHLGDLFLGGSTIIKTSFFKKYFHIATQMTLARSVLLTYNLLAAKNDSCFMSSKKAIIKFLEKPLHYDPGLSLIECWGQFPLINRLNFSYNDRKIIAQKVVSMESKKDLFIFAKFTLIQIFRNKIDLRYHLKFVYANRTLIKSSLLEILVFKTLLIAAYIGLVRCKT